MKKCLLFFLVTCMFAVANSYAQNIRVSGMIYSEADSTALPGTSIEVKGASLGIIADARGSFTLTCSPGAVLIFSSVGFAPKEVSVVTDESSLIIYLRPDSRADLSEVVVTALGVKRSEKKLGYAVQSVNSKELVDAKTVDVGTKLTGKIAGLNVKNSTEFNAAPSIELRGASALLVVDGVPFANMSLRDIAPDDIESISILKGSAASSLYGSRGRNGAIMVQTKRGNHRQGIDVSVNSSSMFTSGFLAFPDVQQSYSSGSAGKYRVGDYVWGDKLDIGRTAMQYNPYTYELEEMPLVSKGKNNLDNFLQPSYILNNNISLSSQGENGGIRSSFTWVNNKGQYPNTKLNKFTAALSGTMKAGKFDMEAGFTYNKRYYPNNIGTGYGGSGYLYNLIVWSGTEFDIRDYKNYWIQGKEGSVQNWMDKVWYNNPYFIANEMLNSDDYDFTNSFLTLNYGFTPWLKATLRSGLDYYAEKWTSRRPIGTVGDVKGSYSKYNYSGYSLNNDLLLQANKTWGKFSLEGLVGGTLYYWNSNSTNIATQNGLSVPGFYSIYASVDPPAAGQSQSQQQVNSLYGKATLSYNDAFFLDITGRNDWNSTLLKEERSYFYPSIAGSWVLSETFHLPRAINLLKIRGAWTQAKTAPSVYEINNTYNINVNVWDGLATAAYPTSIRSKGLRPQTLRSFETGLAGAFLRNRLKFDIAYYNNLYYDNITYASVSSSSGFSSTLINTEEEIVRKGWEATLSATIIKNTDWEWEALLNWSKSHRYYHKLDPLYSSDKLWVKEGARYDWVEVTDYERDNAGNIIHVSGYPSLNKFPSFLGFSDPNYIVGLTNSIRWKQFQLSFTIDGRVGGVMFNTMNQALWNSGSHIDSDNDYRYDQVVNGLKNFVGQGVVVTSGSVQRDAYGQIIEGSDTRVYAPNDVAVTYESYMVSLNPYIGSRRIQNFFDPTFMKLRDLSISYILPNKISERVGLRNVSLGLVGQNLLLWTKEFKFSDPDVGSDNLNSPSIRYLGFNLKFSF